MIKQIIKNKNQLNELITNELNNIETDLDDDEITETIELFIKEASPKHYPVFAFIEFHINKYNIAVTNEYFTKNEINNLKWE